MIKNDYKKLKRKKALLALISSTMLVAQNVEAQDEVKEQWKGKLFSALDKLAEASDKIEQPITDFAKNVSIYKQDSLKMITSMPKSNPDDERCYYFIDVNAPSLTRNYYVDSYGNKVSKDSDDIAYRVDQTNYIPLGNDEASTYIEKTFVNVETKEITKNVVCLSSDYMYDDTLDDFIEFGVFEDVSEIIPSDLQHTKYTTAQLEMICETLNDLAYTISDGQKLERN